MDTPSQERTLHIRPPLWLPLAVAAIILAALSLAGCVQQRPESQDTMADISRSATELPPPIARGTPETVTVDLVTKEVRGELAEGVTYEYWTYNGTVPGPFLRVREGDTVQIRLTHSAEGHEEDDHAGLPRSLAISPLPAAEAHGPGEEEGARAGDDEAHAPADPHAGSGDDAHAAAGHAKHSIDLHAVIGPGGGAPLTQVATGETRIFEFRASRPGIFVYHCASPHIPTHVANGMYGMILVEPKEGLPNIDREFAVVQGEFYTKGTLGEKGHQEFSKEKLLAERPEYVVFNGKVGALTGEGALRAHAGEKIRLFFGVGSHLASNFHIIGGVLDRLHPEGAIVSPPLRNVQTTIVPPGGAMMAEFTIDVPGTYLLVDHSLTRAIDRGAVAELVIEGEPRPDLYRAVNPDPTHTHADFTVMMEGKELDFSDPKYMEEAYEEGPGEEHADDRSTMHMHGGAGHVIHRHKPEQTLGEFFTSIGVVFQDDCFRRDVPDGTLCLPGNLRMFVNGRESPLDLDYVFEDTDQILLTDGSDEATIQEQLQAMTDDTCLYSKTCPERGAPPPENCVADPEVPCVLPTGQ